MATAPSPATRPVETILTMVAGGALGGAAGTALGSIFGARSAFRAGMAAAISAGVNGAFGGYRQVYDWRSVRGWFAFVSDSTWGLLGTTLGNLLNLVNLRPGAAYRPDFSRRQNRQVFARGFTVRRGFALTHGNVVSNAATGRESLAEDRRPFIDRHEDLHIWQNRIFGPLYQAVYAAWSVGGALVGAAAWAITREKPKMRKMVETAAYYDNPFEFWAYKRDHHWEDNSAEPTLKWRRPGWLAKQPPAAAQALGTRLPPLQTGGER